MTESEEKEPPVFEYGNSATLVDFDGFVLSLWSEAMANPAQLFRYNLTDVVTRLIPGDDQIVLRLQRNPKRITHRRKPADMYDLQQPFNSELFHFNQINPNEVLFKIKRHFGHMVEYHNIVINVSPIDRGHCLIVPYPKLTLPQVLTCNSLEICLELVSMSKQKGFCVVANSLLAYASVNHLHYHFLYIKENILFDRLVGKAIVDDVCFELVNHPMCGFGFTVESTPKECASNVFRVIEVLLQKCIPHNLVIKRGKHFSNNSDVIKVILIPKLPAKGAKIFASQQQDMPGFVIAAMEVAGFIVVGDNDKYDSINEKNIIKEFNKMSISQETYTELKKSILEMFS